MKNTLLSLVLLSSSLAFGQGITIPVPNATATGTTLNTLTKYTVTGSATSAVIASAGDTAGVVGITTSGAGTSGTANVAILGVAPCVFDNATTADDYVQISGSVAGNCHDAGSTRPTSGEIIGRVSGTGGSAGTYNVSLDKDIYPAVSGGGVTSLTGDGNLVNNSASTGAVTLTLPNAAAYRFWGNSTGSTAAPGYTVITAAALPATLQSGTAITNAALTTPNIGVASGTSLNFSAGGSLSSSDTGSPTFTFGTNKVVLNQPLTISPTTNQLVVGGGSNLATLNFPAPSGAVTLTFPNTTTNVLGGNSDTTTTHVCHATATAGICNFAAIATGDLPTSGIPNVVYNNAANSGTSAMTLDLSAATTANAFKAPVGAGLTSGADGAIAYDSTAKLTHVRTNGADSIAATTTTTSTTTTQVLHATATAGVYSPSAIAAGDLPSTLSSGTAITNASLTTPNIGAATYTSLTSSTRCAATGTAASPSVVSCSTAPTGSFSCATNASGGTCTINTSAVTANSAILVQPDSSLGTLLSVTCNTTADSSLTAPRISARSAGTSFTITLGTFSTNPVCFSYEVIN